MRYIRCGPENVERLDPDLCIPCTRSSAADLVKGIVPRDGVRTKHYLQQEIEMKLTKLGFEVCSIDRVEYGFDVEFCELPPWMAEEPPWPHDWLVVAKRIK